MAGGCFMVDRKRLKCALEFSFIGLCKNIFGCSKSRITIQGKIVFKSNDEEVCTLNFDDTLTHGQSVFGLKDFFLDELCKPSNSVSSAPKLKPEGPASDITYRESVSTFHNTKSGISRNQDNSDAIPFDVLSIKGQVMNEFGGSDLQSVSTTSCINDIEGIQETPIGNKTYKNTGRIRCCACKHSDAEDGSWDDDKASVVVDDDDLTENFESGKLCLESMEDDEIPQGNTLNGKKLMTDIDFYRGLLSKIKSKSDCIDPARPILEANYKTLNQEFEKESSMSSENKLPNFHIQTANNLWKRNSRYRHVCQVCGMAFTFRTNLTRHSRKIHGCKPDRSCLTK